MKQRDIKKVYQRALNDLDFEKVRRIENSIHKRFKKRKWWFRFMKVIRNCRFKGNSFYEYHKAKGAFTDLEEIKIPSFRSRDDFQVSFGIKSFKDFQEKFFG